MPITLSAKTAECPVQLNSVLLNQELSDVQISVVGNQKKPKLFHAHKLVLAIASDVFKTMFFGSVPQENPVVVKDSNPAAFEAFLRFVYTGTTTITEADVFPLLNLGKKYMVGSLITIVMNHVEGCITSENVGQLVLAGQNFLDDAPPKFWKSVETHGEALLQSGEFLQLRKDTVQALVQGELEVDEKLIYDKAVAWAAAECGRNKLPINDETIRNALDGILPHVRFPAMTAEEFARGPASEAEKVQVLSWFAAAIPQSIFPDMPRYAAESYVCERLPNRNCGMWNNTGATHAIDFWVSRAVSVTGFGACSFYYSGYQTIYSIVARLTFGSVELTTKNSTGTTNQASEVIPLNFDKPIKKLPLVAGRIVEIDLCRCGELTPMIVTDAFVKHSISCGILRLRASYVKENISEVSILCWSARAGPSDVREETIFEFCFAKRDDGHVDDGRRELWLNGLTLASSFLRRFVEACNASDHVVYVKAHLHGDVCAQDDSGLPLR